MTNNVIFVTGLTAAGKTTVADRVAALCAGRVRRIEFSTLLKDELSPVPPQAWDTVSDTDFVAAGCRASHRMLGQEPALITGHVFASRPSGRLVLDCAWDALLPCRAVVFLYVSVPVLKDRQRQWRNDVSSAVDDDQDFALLHGARRCCAAGTPLVVLPNTSDGDVESAVMAIHTMLTRGIS
jgi:hypothetical protein